MQSSFSRKQGGYYSLESINVSSTSFYLYKQTHPAQLFSQLWSYFFFFFNFSTIYFLASRQSKVTENWLLQAHGITYLQILQSRVCYLSIFSSLLISCIPVRALMAIILPFSSDNKRKLIICDPWWRLCSLEIMKKYFFPFYFHILCDKSMRH